MVLELRKIQYARCDDRLVHGQIVYKWLQYLNFNQVFIIDDGVAEDYIQKRLLKLSLSGVVPIQFFSCYDFANFESQSLDKTLILFKSLSAVLKLSQEKIFIKTLNLGRLPAGAGRKKIEKGIYIDRQDLETLKDFLNKGMEIFIQVVPDENKINIKDRIKIYEKIF